MTCVYVCACLVVGAHVQMCMYVCVHMLNHVCCVRVHVHMYSCVEGVQVWVGAQARMCECACVNVCVNVWVHMLECVYVCVCTCLNVYVCVCCVYVWVHMHSPSFLWMPELKVKYLASLTHSATF